MARSQLDLVRWLVRDYGFSELDAYQFATQTVESPLANVSDTNYTCVAKLRKEWLPAGRPTAACTHDCGTPRGPCAADVFAVPLTSERPPQSIPKGIPKGIPPWTWTWTEPGRGSADGDCC